MARMSQAEIASFVQARVAPLHDAATESPIYRCSATLVDGLHLPCVVVKSRRGQVDLARRRFAECLEAHPGGLREALAGRGPRPENRLVDYRAIVGTFVCDGGRVPWYKIKCLDESPYAIPPDRMAEIGGETSMGWTQFTAVMTDGKRFEFGTTFSTEFFDMPVGYAGRDIARIIPTARGARRDPVTAVYREKPFFDCYVEGI